MARMDWLLGRRRPAAPRESDEVALLREARRISESFRGIGGSVRMGVEIPLPEVEIDRGQVDDFNFLATEMAEAQRRAHLTAQVAHEMRRGAEAIDKSRQRIGDAHIKAAEEVAQAYNALGLEPPLMRSEEELRAAQRRLEREMARLAGMI